MNDAMLTALSQFGAAGLIGLLWLLERRSAAARERQLDEAHRRLASGQHSLAALLGVIKDNTRAFHALELSQRRLIELLSTTRSPRPGAPVRGPIRRA